MAMLDHIRKSCERLRRPSLHVVQRASRGRDVRLHVVFIDPEVIEANVNLFTTSAGIQYWQ